MNYSTYPLSCFQLGQFVKLEAHDSKLPKERGSRQASTASARVLLRRRFRSLDSFPQDRSTGWLTEKFHLFFRETMLHAAAREGLFCPAYCLMPDHLHLIWMGLRLDSDQMNGMAFLRTYIEPALMLYASKPPQVSAAMLNEAKSLKFQPQAHDRVLRELEREHKAFANVCSYILENPVKAELVSEAGEWKFCGSVVAGNPKLHPLQAGYWEKFWKLYAQAREPDAGNLRRPPFWA